MDFLSQLSPGKQKRLIFNSNVLEEDDFSCFEIHDIVSFIPKVQENLRIEWKKNNNFSFCRVGIVGAKIEKLNDCSMLEIFIRLPCFSSSKNINVKVGTEFLNSEEEAKFYFEENISLFVKKIKSNLNFKFKKNLGYKWFDEKYE